LSIFIRYSPASRWGKGHLLIEQILILWISFGWSFKSALYAAF